MRNLRGHPLVTLSLGVLLGHLWLAGQLLPLRLGLGDVAAERPPARIEVAFVRELEPAAPPSAPPVQMRRLATAPAAAASVPAALPPLPDTVLAVEPLPDMAALAVPEPIAAPPLPEPVLPVAAASASAAAAASASSPQAFEWPPSTRLSYTLSGYYRGPVEGQARVEWLRSGIRYQVFMEVSIGPAFAPLLSRRVSSEGEITPEGLSPRRYDEETRAVLREPRRNTIFLDADRVRLPSGRELPRPPGVQDSASQFVHLTWLFTTRPELLTVGTAIELPLALPRHVQAWTYDVLASETLATPAGAVQAMHVKPRREPRAGADLAAEIWVAPSLQYLPVRIVIRQDAQNFIDLLIERLPQQAAEGK